MVTVTLMNTINLIVMAHGDLAQLTSHTLKIANFRSQILFPSIMKLKFYTNNK